MKRVLVMMIALAFICGCSSAGSHLKSSHPGAGDKVTASKTHGKIYIGMTSAQVEQALGSPVVKTTDKKGLEVWVYDKISDISYSRNAGCFCLLRTNAPEAVEAKTDSHRMLTVVVKFDEDRRIRDICTHSHRVKEQEDEDR
ncbi:MAG: hypothetical protein JXB40_03665 [Candidatus Omnitrophica bacterium]|nr:hypothetical protein [Candidatus Omnitrophota bacterium]